MKMQAYEKMIFIGKLNEREHTIDDFESDILYDGLYQCPSCKTIHIVTDEERYKITTDCSLTVLCYHNGNFKLVKGGE